MAIKSSVEPPDGVAGLLITTEAAVADMAEDKNVVQPMAGSGMGGMDF